LVAVLIAEDPAGHVLQVLDGGDFVGVNKKDDVFKNLLMQEEIGGPEVKRPKQTCGRFGAPIVKRITELKGTICQSK